MNIKEWLNLPEAGLLRDKLIAEEKGILSAYTPHGVHIYHTWKGSTISIDAPRWSTNRKDAFELWDELPFDKWYREYIAYHSVVFYNPFFEEMQECVGYTFADVVSKAWLLWKCGKRR